MSDDVRVAYVTAPQDKAAEIARELVDRRLCACINIISEVRSIYRWEGAVEDDPEALLIIKTTASVFEALRQAVVELHPYDVPEVVSVPVVAGHAPYLEWVRAEVTGP